MRLIVSIALTLLVLSSAQATTIWSSNGKTAEVAGSHASNFQCLVSGLEATGYRIDFMGGYRRHGSVRHSKHPLGLALDVNQTGRGRVTRPLPSSATSIAASCGLFHGALWHNQDQGHFEVGGRVYAERSSRHRSHRSRSRIAQAPSAGLHWPWEAH
jgi:hypothetical protein